MRKSGNRKAYPRLYKIWQGIRQRCNNPKDKDYSDYGGRGIQVCEEWNSSSTAFIEWSLQNGYNPKLTIDRIDTNGHYNPDNCRWASWTQQARNKRTEKTNKLGVKGVHYDRGKYRAIIYVNNKRIDLGRYIDVEDAKKARKRGEIEYWGNSA